VTYKLYDCISILYYDYIIYHNIADVIKIAPYYDIAVTYICYHRVQIYDNPDM